MQKKDKGTEITRKRETTREREREINGERGREGVFKTYLYVTSSTVTWTSLTFC